MPITAAEARDLHPANAAEVHLRDIYDQIRTAAQAGKTSIRFPYALTDIRGDGSVSVKGATGQAVKDQLERLGYEIRDHWEDGQFVDAYLTIEWGRG